MRTGHLIAPTFIGDLGIVVGLVVFSNTLVLVLIITTFFSNAIFITTRGVCCTLIEGSNDRGRDIGLARGRGGTRLLVRVTGSPRVIDLLAVKILTIFITVPLFFKGVRRNTLGY